ncbi:MAG: beta-galactosidase [Planctomycetes bacterium]|nr:beta-galactosidase [Planctomycetota bacterium]
MTVEIRDRRVFVEGEPFPLLSGELHYWRHDPSIWPKLLAEIAALGLTAVSTYVPWSVHEVAPGRFDFGSIDPRNDVGAFLDLAAERGLRAIVRPGPHVNAELTRFGFPERIFRRPECLAQTGQGTVAVLPVPPRAFPCPSYASEAFLEEVATWFAAVAPVLKGRLAPAGPIVAVQVDNEMSYFFRTATYDQDYSDGAVALFRRFLEEKGRAGLGAAPPSRFEARSPEDLVRHLDWIEFKEEHLARTLARLRGMLEREGVKGVLFTHNYPPARIHAPPFAVPLAERSVDAQGIDVYQSRTQYHYAKRNFLYLEGTSRFPAVWEFATGSTPLVRPIELADERFLFGVALMHGIRAFNFYMTVERDRWYGSPVAADGRRRAEHARALAEWVALFRELSLDRTRRRSDVLLILPREYLRLEAATDVFDPLPPPILDDLGARAKDRCLEDRFGLPEAAQLAGAREWETWYWALSVLGYPFALGDSLSTPEVWRRHRALVVPTSSFLSAEFELRLLDYAAAGGSLVVGPRLPEIDLAGGEGGRLLEALGRPDPAPGLGRDREVTHGKGRILRYGEPLLPATSPRLPAGLDRTVRLLLSKASLAPLYPAVSDLVETAWHDGDGYGVLFAANPTPEPLRAAIRFEGRRTFHPPGGGTPRAGTDGWQFDLGPYTVAALRVTEEES